MSRPLDRRDDDLLLSCAATAQEHRLAIAWTDGVEGTAAKRCGSGWKLAMPLAPGDEAAAAFSRRCRNRNPAVVASASGLVLVDADGGLVGEMTERLGLPRLPITLGAISRRGSHAYLRPPTGYVGPRKVELAADGATVSSDGYLVLFGALHETGHVYEPVNVTGGIAPLPTGFVEAVVKLAERTKTRFVDDTGGEPIPKGRRNETLFSLALQQVRAGTGRETISASLRLTNTERCRPPLPAADVEAAVSSAVRYAARHDTARTEAEQILAVLLDDTEEVAARTEPSTASPPPPMTTAAGRALRLLPLRGIDAERVEWAIPGLIPLGTLSLVAGVGGLGKSALLLAWAKQLAAAGENVVVISYEDDAAHVIRPRFDALGGDLDRLFVVEIANAGVISFPTDLPGLDRVVREVGARAILIDPVSAAIDLRLDAHKDADVRVVLGQLARLASEQRLAVVMNAHLNKALSTDVYVRVNGSTGFYNASRSVLTVTADPSDPDHLRLVAHHKSNYGPLAPVERWRLDQAIVPSPSGPIATVRMTFVEVASDVSREVVLGTHRGEADLERAKAVLEDELADGAWHDSAPLKVLVMEMADVSATTVKRAARHLGVQHERRGFPGSTWWRLPQLDQPLPPDGEPTGDRP